MRLVDVKATDGSLVNPEQVVSLLAEGDRCYLYMADGSRLWCFLSAEEVAKALRGEPTKEQLAAMYEELASLMATERDLLRHPGVRRDFDALQQQLQERQAAHFMSHSIKIKPDDGWKWWDRAPTA